MTTTAQSIIREVQVTLVDEEGERYPATKLVRDLNDMQRAIQSVRPDSTAADATVVLVEGWAQTLPATAASLIEITNLNYGDFTAVTQTTREMLDAIEPRWRSAPAADTVHWMLDLRHPRRFDVYPPSSGGSELAGVVSMYPTDVPEPTGPAWSDVTGDISLADEFKNALFHLVCWRQYLHAAEFANEPEIAKAHLDMAVRDVGESLLAKLNQKPGVAADATAAEPQ